MQTKLIKSVFVWRGVGFVALMMVLGLGWAALPATAQDGETAVESPIGRCINMGNGLEAPSEGVWGYLIVEEHFDVIAEAGFDTVRVPVRWSAYAEDTYPYTIDPDFMARVTDVVDQALARDLNVILNIHHYEAMMSDPDGHSERLIFLWLQIAAHFVDYPDGLLLEVLNEPNAALDDEKWNALQPVLVSTIRSVDANRIIVVGGSDWNSLDGLQAMELPDDDNLIATVHYYLPFQFTHQGAEWVDGAGGWLGTDWGTPAEVEDLATDLDTMVTWSEDNGVPLFIGEFGAYSRAEMTERVEWTAAVVSGAEARGLGWCYWEFGSGFGAYIPSARIWRDELKNALLQPDPAE